MPTSLLHTATYSRRLLQWRPSQPSHVHQDIHSMSLVHVLCFFSPTRPPAYRHRHCSPAFTRSQPAASTKMQDDAGSQGAVWVACEARTQTLGDGLERQGVRGDELCPRYTAATLYRLCTPPPDHPQPHQTPQKKNQGPVGPTDAPWANSASQRCPRTPPAVTAPMVATATALLCTSPYHDS